MIISEFLADLKQLGIELRVAPQDRIECSAPKGVMTKEIGDTIRKYKKEIIAFLKLVPANNWSSLVPIQPHGSRPPFFCFHGVGGNVLNYAILTKHLGEDQPLYGLQSVGLDGITEPFDRIEPMAAHYIKEIQSVQPHGPYFFGGGSMGGMIALEAAQQLQKKGEKIGLLVMFDTIGPNHNITSGGRLLHRIKKHNMLELLTYAKDRMNESLINKQKMEKCLEFKKNKEPIPHDLRFWFVEKMNYLAMSRYEYSVFSGKITLLKSSDEEGGLWSDPLRGWRDMATDGLEIHEIPGHHDHLVEQPLLGKKLAECLLAAQNNL